MANYQTNLWKICTTPLLCTFASANIEDACMRKINKAVSILKTILRHPSTLNRVLEAPEIWKKKVAAKGFEGGLPVLGLDTLVTEFPCTVNPYLFLDGGSLPTDLALLRSLAQRFPSCRYFEIGTWRGESVANVAQLAAVCYTLNFGREEMKKAGAPEGNFRQVGLLSKPYPNVVHLEGNSLYFDFQQFKEPFDLIFIDGDHHYAQVKNDTEKAYRYLRHENSIIAWHDYANHPESVRYEVLAGILDGLPEEAYPHLFHVSHTKTAIFFKEGKSTNHLTPPVTPDASFRLKILRQPL